MSILSLKPAKIELIQERIVLPDAVDLVSQDIIFDGHDDWLPHYGEPLCEAW
jgi:hypothetical protein